MCHNILNNMASILSSSQATDNILCSKMFNMLNNMGTTTITIPAISTNPAAIWSAISTAISAAISSTISPTIPKEILIFPYHQSLNYQLKS